LIDLLLFSVHQAVSGEILRRTNLEATCSCVSWQQSVNIGCRYKTAACWDRRRLSVTNTNVSRYSSCMVKPGQPADAAFIHHLRTSRCRKKAGDDVGLAWCDRTHISEMALTGGTKRRWLTRW